MNVIFNGQPYELVRVSGDLALIRSFCVMLCVPVHELSAEPEKPAAKKKTNSVRAGSPRSAAKKKTP